MTEEQQIRHNVIFLGPLSDGADHLNKLTEGLKDRFNVPADAVDRIMKRAPVMLKKDVTLSEAQRYKEALEAIGAKVQLEPVQGMEEQLPQEEGATPAAPEPEPPSTPVQGQPPTPPQGMEEQLPQEEGATPAAAEPEPQFMSIQEEISTPPQPAVTSGAAVAGTVQCPQCSYVQEATDECVKCGIIISKFLKYQEEVKVPEGETVSSESIGAPLDEAEGYTPWEDMTNLGVVTAFFRTMKEVLFSPTLFFRNMPVNKGIQSPLLFGVIIGFVGGLLNLLWQYAFSGVLGTINVFLTAYVLIYAFALPFLIAIGLFVFSGVFHVVLMVVGGDKRGFEATFRVVSYTTSTQVLSLLPLLGWLIAAIYNLVLWIIGFRESHRIGTGRAALAVFLPGILVAVLILIVIFMLVVPLITSQTQMMMQRPPTF